ncbi:dTDP-4-dehydrorhamnose reductase [Peptoclostridium litorale DSM 5388]|uniref:dTDP-4-dehydrorhamnose reductase n=1 Tax=Peptoclostridium litorale DSM 5388 TaxID=1121324 RepID=A0A069REI4_PEPLI|nr:dTDP-4-dehydrorhamnose reductase [Peptoclostridium litorale]KDR94585.1 spore coat polysaccharide biosynthesis protein SpsK [Peptoclostridium litorale DSM 5388]SIO31745.1 dTDP-4-dehydrorhamnose reductase [Peptoclostridium litorale DSM 5388]
MVEKLLISGCKGQLGTELSNLLKGKYNVVGTERENLDITDRDEVARFIRDIRPSVVINAAAYNNVDRAESEEAFAFLVNSKGPENLAIACEEVGAKFVHISSDYVFDGKKSSPYVEEDDTNPLNVYGMSKVEAERLVSAACSRHFLLRTAWLYGAHGNNFLKTMLSLSEQKSEIKVVDDQVGTPTYSLDLAMAIEHLISTDDYGLYHVTNSGQCSWNGFAREIFSIAEKDIDVIPIRTQQTGRDALRPSYSVLQNRRLERDHGYYMRSWQDALKEFLSTYL